MPETMTAWDAVTVTAWKMSYINFDDPTNANLHLVERILATYAALQRVTEENAVASQCAVDLLNERDALRAENARLRESAELNADYHRREMRLQTEITSLALEESSAGGEAMSGWPNPDKPGVPLNSDRHGWHWLLQPVTERPWIIAWNPDWNYWGAFPGISPNDMGHPKLRGYKYLGPVLTPIEADALRLAADVQATVSEMRVDLDEGFRLAAKVALAALEAADGVFYARDQGEHLNLKRAHHRVKQKLEEAATA
jgi:hypothetical protein